MSDSQDRRELAERARARLVEGLDGVLGDRLRLGDGERHERNDELVRVDPYAVAFRCPRRLAHPAADYEDSAANVRRRIGLLALRHAATAPDDRSASWGALDLAASVEAVLADTSDWYPSLREWVGGLDRAGRVSVAAAALTWGVDVVRLVGGGDRIVWTDPLRPPRWNVPGRAVQLRASTDAILGGPLSGQKLLVISDAVPGPGDRIRAGHVAVVHAVASGRTPVRVSIGSPASGHVVRHEVDEPLVDLVTDRIVESVQLLADRDSAPAVPGSWCRHCHLRSDCAEGTAHLAG